MKRAIALLSAALWIAGCPDFPQDRIYACSDDEDCPEGQFCDPSSGECSEDCVNCNDGVTCIPGTAVCDGTPDCPGGEDESDATCNGCVLCADGVTCIRPEQVCDGVTFHCPFGEDEGFVACCCGNLDNPNYACTTAPELCDFTADCPAGSPVDDLDPSNQVLCGGTGA